MDEIVDDEETRWQDQSRSRFYPAQKLQHQPLSGQAQRSAEQAAKRRRRRVAPGCEPERRPEFSKRDGSGARFLVASENVQRRQTVRRSARKAIDEYRCRIGQRAFGESEPGLESGSGYGATPRSQVSVLELRQPGASGRAEAISQPG